MNVAKPLTSVTLEEFEQMEKTAHINYELIDGIVLMAPGPSREHQKIAVFCSTDQMLPRFAPSYFKVSRYSIIPSIACLALFSSPKRR